MEKYIRFDSVDSLGRVFAEAIDIAPRGGGGLEKLAGQLHPEVQLFMRGLKPDPRYQYVLMTPMGSYEFYGMNANGDLFPELGLGYDRNSQNPLPVVQQLEEKWLKPFGKSLPPGNYKDFGYRSFLDAKRYQHHQNKNPDLAFGDIVLSCWNSAMHRAEVIARHFREKAKQVGAEEIIADLDQGKPRQISMGARVAFDVCTICGHISRTTHDYCEHLKTAMGTVLRDGRVCGAVNLFPRFFDLSDVFVPAAKESGVLMKVAHSLPKTATVKLALRKVADIEKEILPNAGHQAIQDTCASECDLPQRVLRGGDFGTLLSTLAAMGIVLKPREFQDGLLARSGHTDLADKLWENGEVFAPGAGPGASAEFSAPDFNLAEGLSSILPQRSGFYPHLPQRMLRVVVINMPSTTQTKTASDSGLLKKVAAAYEGYRRSFVGLPRLLDLALSEAPEYYNEHFFKDVFEDALRKHASFHSMDLSTPLVPLYLYNAHRGVVVDPPRTWDFQVPNHSAVRALLSPAF